MDVATWQQYLTTRSSKLLDAIVREEMPFIRDMAKHFARKHRSVDYDDIVQDLSVGLIKAIDRWDPERGTWRMYAFHLMKRELHAWRKRSALISHPDGHVVFDNEDGDIFRRLSSPAEAEDITDGHRLVEEIKQLKPREQETLLNRFMLEESVRETSKHIGCSPQRVQQIQDEALKKLKKRMAFKPKKRRAA